jgi:hypothetical protein
MPFMAFDTVLLRAKTASVTQIAVKILIKI